MQNTSPTTARKKIPFEDIFRSVAADVGEDHVDWKLLAAHAFVESSFNPKAFNPEGSSGLMQILLPVSHNRGARTHLADGNIPEWENLDASRIFDPEYNITLACALIRANVIEFGMPRAIAVYNNSKAEGSPQFGPFPNAGYVNKVQAYFDKLKSETGE